ncbi:MAG: 2-phosphosulfolactate phosphatase [Tepidisphaeraceae bacterium]|jgi:2-phosphosulfolactate phosphatase
MLIDVVYLPADLHGANLSEKTVVVFDVLRATTSITAALAVGVRSIRAFADLYSAQSAAATQNPRPLLCGEIHALRAPGFDLGNSPGQFTPEYAGREVFLSTTNGTKALAAARAAGVLCCGALVNATAVAKFVAAKARDAILLCSGTEGAISMEDILGAGAVSNALLEIGNATLATDAARVAHRLFQSTKTDLPAVLRQCQGGRNIIRAGLEPDIDFCARLDAFALVGVSDKDLVIRSA